MQYADYTLWQRDLLGAEDDPDSVLTRQLAFWRDALAGAPDQLELPTDRPRPATPSHRGGLVEADLGTDLYRALLELARDSQTTLFMVLQAALAALLTRLGAGTDIPLGTPVAGRSDEALDDLVGFFVNTLVLRTDTSGDPTFRDLLARVRDADLAAYSHQDVPFERLVELVNPERTLARHPLFQVMLVLQNNAQARLDLPGLDAEIETVSNGRAKFDLTMAFAERPDGLGCAPGVRHRPVRPGHRRAAARPAGAVAGDRGRQAGPGARAAPGADRGRDPDHARDLERHRHRVPARPHCPRARSRRSTRIAPRWSSAPSGSATATSTAAPTAWRTR